MTDPSVYLSTTSEQSIYSASQDLKRYGCNTPRVISLPPTPPRDANELMEAPRIYPSKVQDDMKMATLASDNNVRHDGHASPVVQPQTRPPPVVLLIHGAWHTPAHYFPLLHALTKAGFLTLCPQLPTCNNVVPPPCSLADDITMIRKVALDLANAGHPIIALMHSYGGVVGTEALAGLGWHARQENCNRGGQDSEQSIGGVVALVYMASFMLPLGFSLATPFGGNLPPFMTENSDGTCSMIDPYYRFFSADISPEQVKCSEELLIPPILPWLSPALLLAQLTGHPTSAQTTAITSAAYLDPSMSTTYLVCEKDVALIPEAQRGIIELARSNGVKVHQETCQAGHSPFLSIPEDVAAVVCRAWDRWKEGETCVTATGNDIWYTNGNENEAHTSSPVGNHSKDTDDKASLNCSEIDGTAAISEPSAENSDSHIIIAETVAA